jgi:hypothetical protein
LSRDQLKIIRPFIRIGIGSHQMVVQPNEIKNMQSVPALKGRGIKRVGVGLVPLPTSLFLRDPDLKAGVSSRRDEVRVETEWHPSVCWKLCGKWN